MKNQNIREICQRHQLQCNEVTKIIGSFDSGVFNVDDKYLIRTSKQSMIDEQNKINRIKDLEHVPHIISASEQIIEDRTIYYIILEYMQGTELLSVYNDLSDQDIHDIGTSISDFLTGLHSIKGEKYDIGHYIPIIPNHDKSWRTGHELYWDYIYKGIKEIQLDDCLTRLLELSNEYIKTNLSSLDYESGPVLLHNDFHVKNIIIHNKAFAGVIDWECSQFGERDFELIHLLHWSLFPPSKDIKMMNMFKNVFSLQMKINNVPMIERRLTIYMLEHDFMQIIWSTGKRADEFLPRIQYWLEGKQEEYLRSIVY
ncbi:MAG: aminoglycoside phosphotransferase family protein [Anaerolineaceae bacterium]|nr:MAG: aminoglycoside phosphotransferase family protein [Anaerolineaceae bacterium]